MDIAQMISKGEYSRLAQLGFYCFRHVYEGTWIRSSDDDCLVRNREEECFFYDYAPGMPIDVAAELERRAADRREAERDRELTRQALQKTDTALSHSGRKNGIALAALVITTLAVLGNIAITLWNQFHSVAAPQAPSVTTGQNPSPPDATAPAPPPPPAALPPDAAPPAAP
jgi:hypothetical protein